MTEMGGGQQAREQRRAEQAESAKAAILAAAARVFLRDGYQRATMRGIAKEAGYTASSLYTYFESKETLFRSLRESLKRRGLEAIDRPMPKGLNFEQRLDLLTLRLTELALEMKEAMLLYVVADAQLPDESLEERLNHSRTYMERLARWIEETSTPEELNGHSSEDVAYVFFGLIDSQLCRVQETGEPSEERIRAGTALALEYTLSMLSRPPMRRG